MEDLAIMLFLSGTAACLMLAIGGLSALAQLLWRKLLRTRDRKYIPVRGREAGLLLTTRANWRRRDGQR